jgi:hypothetical protein
LFYKERSSDFWEMNLHHSMTLTLIGGMILQNYMRVGTIIIFLHTVPDAFITASRILSQTYFKTATIVSFVVSLLVWMYFRNAMMPLITRACYNNLVYTGELTEYQMAPNILVFFLHCLCFMHAYWIILLWNMLLSGLRAGDTDDKQRNTAALDLKK